DRRRPAPGRPGRAAPSRRCDRGPRRVARERAWAGARPRGARSGAPAPARPRRRRRRSRSRPGRPRAGAGRRRPRAGPGRPRTGRLRQPWTRARAGHTACHGCRRRRRTPAAETAGERREAAHRRPGRLGRGPRAAGDPAGGRGHAGACRRRAGHDDAEEAGRGPDEARPVGRSVPGEDELMLLPKKTKFRKVHRGRRRGEARGQTAVQFGDYGLKALDAGWITNRQIEAARIAMTRKIKRGGKVWINVFPDKSYTKKPAETRMGSGKGSPEGWVAVIKPGRVMFELAGVPEPLAKDALKLAGQKLSIKSKIVKREAELFD